MNSVLMPPLFILIVAIVYRIFLPKKINCYYGYRTKLSMKNQDTWNEANRFAANLLLIGSIAYFPLVIVYMIFIQDREMQMWASAVSLFCLLLGVLFITEWQLKNYLTNQAKADMKSRSIWQSAISDIKFPHECSSIRFENPD